MSNSVDGARDMNAEQIKADVGQWGIESCAYLADGRAFEYYYGYHRSDISRLHFTFR